MGSFLDPSSTKPIMQLSSTPGTKCLSVNHLDTVSVIKFMKALGTYTYPSFSAQLFVYVNLP